MTAFDTQRTLSVSLPTLPHLEPVLTDLDGVEGLSRDARFHLTLIVSGLAKMDSQDFIQQPISFAIHNTVSEQVRQFHGIITFADVGMPDCRGYRQCRFEVTDWFHANMEKSCDCRIYTHQSIPEIFV